MTQTRDDDSSHDELSAVDGITLQKLRIFKIVAELGHFTRAAEYLNISQPVLSSHVRKLEERLGAQLFQRAGRGVALTAAGRRVLRWTTDVMIETADLQSDLSKILTGRLGATAISASPSVGSYALAQMVTDFIRNNPGIQIDLKITSPSEALESVRAGHSSFAVSLLDPSQPVGDLNIELLWEERYLLVCARNSPWAGRRLTLEELSEIPIITGNPSPVRRSIEDQKLLQLGITRRNVVLEFGHPAPVKQAVLEGLGCGFLFESTIVSELRDGQIMRAEVPELDLLNSIFLVVRRRKTLAPMELKLIDHIRKASGNRLDS